jgi:hypothetical protein
MTNTSNLPVEALEMEYPLMVEKYALSENSCGAGKYRGGMGIVRTIRIMEESGDSMLISAATERFHAKPWGLEGGQGGGNASIKVYRDGKLILENPKPRNVALQTGDVIEMITAGAGGYGPVSERDPEDDDDSAPRFCGDRNSDSELPPFDVCDWAGFPNADSQFASARIPDVTIDGKSMQLHEHNDNGATFDQLADAIEAQL